MTTHYSEDFKIDVLRKLRTLRNNGKIEFNDSDYIISNVRELCRFSEISSYTLYKWEKEIELEEEENPLEKKLLEIHEIVKNGDGIAKQDQNHYNPEKKIVADNRLIVKSEIRFFGSVASMLNIKGYSDMPLRQLQLAIGLDLVKRSRLA